MFHSEDYINKLLNTKPQNIKKNNFVNEKYASIVNQKGRSEIKAVLVTDPHVDYKYVPGADKLCNNYLCCGEDDGFPTDPSRQAGEWGEYRCDLPPKTLQAMFVYIRDVIKPDVLFWTGDNSPHVIWKNTEEEVVSATFNISMIMQEVFRPGMSNVTIIPINGNHDLFPANNQDFSKGEN